MALNGEAGRPPLKFGLAAVDLFTGQYAAQAVLAALYQRERTGRGRPRRPRPVRLRRGPDLLLRPGGARAGRSIPPRYGNAHPSIVPYGVFQAGDGPVVLTVGNNGQYRRLCEQVLERPDLGPPIPRFATNLDRSRNRAAFVPVLQAELAKWERAPNCSPASRPAGIPCGEVLGLREALTSRPRPGRPGLVVPPGDREAGCPPNAHVIAPPYRLRRPAAAGAAHAAGPRGFERRDPGRAPGLSGGRARRAANQGRGPVGRPPPAGAGRGPG